MGLFRTNQIQMTNYEKWCAYCDRFSSPQSYIDFGFYWMISAALQRRVWFHSPDKPLYPNQYCFFVGPPATGKGLIITEVLDFLKEPKLTNPMMAASDDVLKILSENEKFVAQKIKEEQYKDQQAKEDNLNKKNKVMTYPPLFASGPDAATFESITLRMADCIRRMDYPKWNEQLQKHILDIYIHCSMFIALEEVASMFRKHMDDLVMYLTKCYDCKGFEYLTISRELDNVVNPCISLLGGTQETFMARIQEKDLISDGFSSRLIGIYESEPRFVRFRMRDLTSEEKQFGDDIKKWLLILAKQFGYIKFSDESWNYMEEWIQSEKQTNINASSKIKHFLVRKHTHAQKLAVAIHYAESTEKEIQLPSFKRAIQLLDGIQPRMHLCYGVTQDNPLNKLKDAICKFINNNGKHYNSEEILAEFWERLPNPEPARARQDIATILERLSLDNQIKMSIEESPKTKQKEARYGKK